MTPSFDPADLEFPMPDQTTATVSVTYVTAPSCHYCEHGRTVLADLDRRIPLDVREVTLDCEEGRRLLTTHRFAFPPAVIVDGRLIAHGRLSARRLARLLPREVR
jgi:hypothetical protein